MSEIKPPTLKEMEAFLAHSKKWNSPNYLPPGIKISALLSSTDHKKTKRVRRKLMKKHGMTMLSDMKS